MMRRAVIWIIVVWAVGVSAFALSAVSDANDDARAIVVIASVLGPVSALFAAWAYSKQEFRVAVVLLLLSTVTPTYSAWPLSLVPVVLAVVIVLTRSRDRSSLV